MITTYGYEIEVKGANPYTLLNMLKSIDDGGCTYTDDGSLRTSVYTIGEYNVLNVENALIPIEHCSNYIVYVDGIGTEINTRAMGYTDAERFSRIIAKSIGHLPFMPECSIQIHVSVHEMPWKVIQNILILCYGLEHPIYRISAGGVPHRGMVYVYNQYNGYQRRRTNGILNHKYARPLSDPILTESEDGYLTSVIKTEGILKAKRATHLLQAFGEIHNGRTGHYNPARLHAINILPIFRFGTIEFRMFNNTYKHLPVFTKLVKALYDKAITLYKEKKDALSEIRRVFGNEMLLYNRPPEEDEDVLLKMEEFLEISIPRKVWGTEWTSCNESQKHHYGGTFSVRDTWRPLQDFNFVNNRDQEDDGTDDFIIVYGD